MVYSENPFQTTDDFPHEENPAFGSDPAVLPPMVQEGIRLFNRREFFAAHEALEIAWRKEKGPVRDLYRGILQTGIAYYHIERRNYLGAIKMFTRARYWLGRYPDVCIGINVHKLMQDLSRVEKRLIDLGPDRITEIHSDYFPSIEIIS